MDFSLGISWIYGILAVSSMLLFPFFRGKYAFIAGILAYSLVDIIPALLGVQGTLGVWTIVGALTWGFVGFLFTIQNPNGSPFTFAKLGFVSTLVFDFVTGCLMSPILFNMPFQDALIGQVPFTIKHLLGICAVSILFAPVIFPSVRKALLGTEIIILKPKEAFA